MVETAFGRTTAGQRAADPGARSSLLIASYPRILDLSRDRLIISHSYRCKENGRSSRSRLCRTSSRWFVSSGETGVERQTAYRISSEGFS